MLHFIFVNPLLLLATCILSITVCFLEELNDNTKGTCLCKSHVTHIYLRVNVSFSNICGLPTSFICHNLSIETGLFNSI